MAPRLCPHCGVLANLEARYVWEQWLRAGPQSGSYKMGVWTCQSCGGPVVGMFDDDEEGPDPRFHFPRSAITPQLGSGTPPLVAEDASEAYVCLSAGAWRAAAAMARRAIQAAALDQGAPADLKLQPQIDWLEGERIITPLMKEAAHKIRLGGNLGAHPSADGLRDVDEDAAKRVVEFMRQFLWMLYEYPVQLESADPESSGYGPVIP